MPDELVAMMTSSATAASILAIRSRLYRAAPVRSLGQDPAFQSPLDVLSKTSLFCDALSAMPSSRRVGQ